MITKLSDLLNVKGKKRKISVAVAQDSIVLEAVVQAVKLNVASAILVGDKNKILEIAQKNKLDLSDIEIMHEEIEEKAVQKSVMLVSEGKADYIMKGMTSTANLLHAVLAKEANLRKSGLLSHVMVYQVPTYHKLLFLTDGGMITYPELNEKVEIVKNAVSAAINLGVEKPKVAALCAVEVVNPAMQCTIDASSLMAMNKRGQIKNCIIEGPLALDNAICIEAAHHKGLYGEVVGNADILLVPNIEAGNLLGKSLTYFAKAESAGVIIGAKCPVVLVSRADSSASKLYSIALGAALSN